MFINLFDLDFTLIDSSHRSYFYNGKLHINHFIRNSNKKILRDKIILPMYKVYKYLENDFNVVITSRTLSKYDFQFLEKYFNFDFYLHRDINQVGKENINLPDYKLKEKLLDFFFQKYYNYIPGFAFDDKEKNLQVFEKYGFQCFNANLINQIQIHPKKILLLRKLNETKCNNKSKRKS